MQCDSSVVQSKRKLLAQAAAIVVDLQYSYAKIDAGRSGRHGQGENEFKSWT